MDLQKARIGLLSVVGLCFAAGSAFSQHTNITGFADNSGGQHIFYLDSNSNLNQLYYLSGTTWQTQNLTAIYGGNTPAAGAPLTSFVDWNNGQHVFYTDSNKHLNQLFYLGGTSWLSQDLSGNYGGALVAGSTLASFFDTSDGSEHVFYVDPNNHVDQFYYPGSGQVWYWQDLTADYGGTTATSSSALAAYEDTAGGQHVFYLDSNTHLSQLFYVGGTSWMAQDLTSLYGGDAPESNSSLTAFLDTSGGQNVVYIDAIGTLNELSYSTGTTWSWQDLSSQYGGVPPGKGTNLASYIDASGGEHIVYVDIFQDLSQLYSVGGSWTAQALTQSYGGNTAAPASMLVAYPLMGDPNMIGQHVAYLDGNDNVNQLYYPATGGDLWFPQNLTAIYGGNAPALMPVSSLLRPGADQ